MVEFREEVLIYLQLHVAHLVFLLGILANLSNPGTTGSDIILTDTLTGGLVEFLQLILVQNHLIAPCPTVVAIVIMNLHKAIEHLLDIVDGAILDIVNQSLFL